MHIIEYAKEHPWATGIVVVIGGIVFISISGIFHSSSSAAASTSGPSAAEIQANATVAAAQIQAQAVAAQAGSAVQAAQIGAGVQMNSDKLSAEVAMEGYRVQESLGLKQIDSNTAVNLHTIDAQSAMFITNSNNQVATQNIIANASSSTAKHGQTTSMIGGIVGSLAGLAGAIFSDARLKENVQLIGRNNQGLGVYAFNYRGSTTGHVGVIAQEVQAYDPALVSEDAKTGYMKVDVSKIDKNYALLAGGPARMAFG